MARRPTSDQPAQPPGREPLRSPTGLPLVFLLLVFAGSRALFWLYGVRFDATTLGIYWQYLDPALLADDLLRSAFLLHSQPPLFNLVLGGVVAIAPGHLTSAFHALLLGASLTTLLCTYALALRLGSRAWTASLVTSLLALSPSLVLFEHWLMYDVPLAATLAASALLLHWASARRSVPGLHAFFFLILFLCGARALFHLVYAVAVLAVLSWSLAFPRATLMRAAAAPLLLLVLLYGKNAILFGNFGPSTWFGMNLARIATSSLDRDELALLSQRGITSPLITIPPFSALAAYDGWRSASERPAPPIPHPLLVERHKTTGVPNYHHHDYIAISRQYRKDALAIARHRPASYLHGVSKAFYNFLRPPTKISHIEEIERPITAYISLTEVLYFGRLPFELPYGDERRPVYLLAWIGFPFLVFFGLFELRRRRRSSLTDLHATPATLGFLLFTVLYVSTVGNLFEVWENGRFRFYIDPFLAVLLAVLADRCGSWAMSTKRREAA